MNQCIDEYHIIMKKYLFIFICLILFSFTDRRVNVFLIGDSISIEYWPYLKQYASGFACLERKLDDGSASKNLDVPMGANGGDSKMVLAYLKSKLTEKNFHPDYLLLNCGLHDIKRNPETNAIQVSEDEYRNNITAIFHLLKKKNIKPVWISTTWVVDSIHNEKQKAFCRFDTDVVKYNQIAHEVCAKNDVAIIDLYTFSKNLGVDKIRDHAHYTQDAQAIQGAYIAGFIHDYIKRKKNK